MVEVMSEEEIDRMSRQHRGAGVYPGFSPSRSLVGASEHLVEDINAVFNVKTPRALSFEKNFRASL